METNVKIEKTELVYIDDGKRIPTGEYRYDFICPQCRSKKNDLVLYRIVENEDGKKLIELECHDCGYQDDIDLEEFLEV